ncbi:MAG: hypothetical protein C7B44_10235 [Sulfobacillus thermosulfidooxidans]|nr:MAG: hypothetical protein C7B44_10235 [Sulfobacillus thermosulfidooxidans]
MKKLLATDALRRLVNTLVDASLTSPSLAEMVHQHLLVEWVPTSIPGDYPTYQISADNTIYWELEISDSASHRALLYQQALALLRIGVNGALVTPQEERMAHKLFPMRVFRTCPSCQQPFRSWLDYYGHLKLDHLLDHQRTG